MQRRHFLAGLVVSAACVPLIAIAAPSADEQVASMERRAGGRLGVFIHDLETGRCIRHRADDRFLMCSTFKLLAVGTLLNRVGRGLDTLDRRVMFGHENIVTHSPITNSNVGQGMTLGDLCEAAIVYSDNTAGNLILNAIGGTDGLNGAMHAFGDDVSHLDREEPKLNNADGDRDTTTPRAMARSVEHFLFKGALTPALYAKYSDWLRAAKPGLNMVRAGLPARTDAGDKAGRGSGGQNNDVTVVWRPGRKAVIIAAYYVNDAMNDDQRNEVLAEIGRLASKELEF
jgi:beta-lactamase class A